MTDTPLDTSVGIDRATLILEPTRFGQNEREDYLTLFAKHVGGSLPRLEAIALAYDLGHIDGRHQTGEPIDPLRQRLGEAAITALMEGKAAVMPIWRGDHVTYLGKPNRWQLRISDYALEEVRLDKPTSEPVTDVNAEVSTYIKPNGCLYSSYPFVTWVPGNLTIKLDGDFSVSDLRSFVAFMTKPTSEAA